MYIDKKVIGNCTLYHGNCLDVIKTFDFKPDHIITDPPFEEQAHKKMRRTLESVKTGKDVSLDFAAITEDLRDSISEYATNNCNGWSMFFCQAEAVAAWRDSIEKYDGKYKRPMIWVKPDCSPQFNGQMPAIGYESIVLQWSGKGHSKWNGGGKRGVYTCNTNHPDRDGTHPTEKPVTLMMQLINDFTQPNDIIFDPFMGSGTTGIACIKLGRKFIGVELDKKYYDLSVRRISATPGSGNVDKSIPDFQLIMAE